MKKHQLLLLAIATGLSTSSTLHAAVINWGAATNISGDLDVSTAGTLVGAFNLGNPPTDTTVNGVTFTGLLPSGNDFTSGNFNFATEGTFAAAGGGSGAAPFSTLSAPYQALLSTALGVNSTPPAFDPSAFTLTMNNLVAGQTYQFEWWFNFSGNGAPLVTTTATAGNSVTLNQNTSGAVNGGLGQFALGTFVADGTNSQAITFANTAGGAGNLINGFQLRQVPEPSTLALLGLPALLGLRRRRLKQPAFRQS